MVDEDGPRVLKTLLRKFRPIKYRYYSSGHLWSVVWKYLDVSRISSFSNENNLLILYFDVSRGFSFSNETTSTNLIL